MLSGDNGILQKATDAKTNTERTSLVEQARTDVLGYQVENKGEDLDKSQLKTVLDTYFKDVPSELPDGDELANLALTTLDKYGTHTIKVSEIYSGNLISENNTRNAITFYLDQAPEQAYEGMTFGEWIENGNFYLGNETPPRIKSPFSGQSVYYYDDNNDLHFAYSDTVIKDGQSYWADIDY